MSRHISKTCDHSAPTADCFTQWYAPETSTARWSSFCALYASTAVHAHERSQFLTVVHAEQPGSTVCCASITSAGSNKHRLYCHMCNLPCDHLNLLRDSWQSVECCCKVYCTLCMIMQPPILHEDPALSVHIQRLCGSNHRS